MNLSNPEPPDDALLSDAQVAEMLNVSVGHVRNGKLPLPFIKIGRAKRTRRSDVIAFVERRRVTTRLDRLTGDVVDIISGQTIERAPGVGR